MQPISGAKIKYISNNLDGLIHNNLKTIILHVGTKNSVEDTLEDIYNDLISLITRIEDKISKCQVLISYQVLISIMSKPMKQQKKSKFIDNCNITDKHLGRRGLHLNSDSHLPKKIIFICFNESPLEMMKNAFYFILKALFDLDIFNFCLDFLVI